MSDLRAGPTIVHIIDDDEGMRKSLQVLMQSSQLTSRAYESARQFLDEADFSIPGCLVLDLRMPGMSGLELLQQLKGKQTQLPVIVVSGHADVKAAVGSMKLGAVDVMLKPFEPKELVAAIRRLIAKSCDLHRLHAESAAVRERMESLTPRELDLLRLVVAGYPNKQIAAELGISIKTVANHRASLMAKTQALNAADLARISTIAGMTPGKWGR